MILGKNFFPPPNPCLITLASKAEGKGEERRGERRRVPDHRASGKFGDEGDTSGNRLQVLCCDLVFEPERSLHGVRGEHNAS